jgi:uncharacterized protein
MKVFTITLFIMILIINLKCSFNVKESDIFSVKKGNYSTFKLPKYTATIDFYKTKDNIDIEYLLLKQENARANIIVFGGRDWDIITGVPLYKTLSDYIPVNIFTINYRGFGNSKAKPSISGVLEDANSSLEFFKDYYEEFNKYPTYILGYSLGSYYATSISNNKNVQGIILISTFTNAHELIDFLMNKRIPCLVKLFLNFKIDQNIYALNSYANIDKYSKPLLIMHGEDDYFIPPAMSKKLFELSPSTNKKLVIIKDVGHNKILEEKLYLDQIANNIKEFIINTETGISQSK